MPLVSCGLVAEPDKAAVLHPATQTMKQVDHTLVPPDRVLMTTDTLGGVWTYAIELAGALDNAGSQVCLATMGRPISAAQRADLRRIPGVEVRESHYKLEWMDRAEDDVEAAGAWLLELEASFKPAVVHLNGYAHGALPWRAPVIVVGHSCVTSWWEAVRPLQPQPEMPWYRRTVLAGLHAANLVVAPTFAMLAALQRHYGVFRSARVVANGRDPSRFARARKCPFVMTAGRLWDPAKNLAALERVAPRLSWPVCAAGEITDASGEERPPRDVTWLGALTSRDLSAWLAHASIYALPARYEPFGLSVLEAALSGCALVLSDIASLRELWDGVALFAGDDQDLADAIEWLIAHPAESRALAQRARRRARRFTPDAMMAGYLQAYQAAASMQPAAVQ